MIVIANKTEYKLRDDLNKVVKDKPTQKFFFLEFSKIDIHREILFETFIRTLEEVPNSYMARVYLCHDKDIAIILDGFMQRHFLDFLQKLSEALKIDDFSNLVSTHEVGVHWMKIEQIYLNKIKELEDSKLKEEEDVRRRKASETTTDILSKIPMSLIESIGGRRSFRDTPKILIADDDQLSRTLAGNVLKDSYSVAYAKNGSQAIDGFVKEAPDILFLDIGMPDINGHDVLEVLFQMDPDAYIIMFSGRKDKTTILKSLRMGANGFLGKPFSRDQVFMHVKNSPHVQNKKC